MLNTVSKDLVIVMALNMETITPSNRATAKPFTKLEVKLYRIKAVMMVVKLESRIDGQARRKPSEIAPA